MSLFCFVLFLKLRLKEGKVGQSRGSDVVVFPGEGKHRAEVQGKG